MKAPEPPSEELSVWRAGLEDLDALVPLFDRYRGFYGLRSDPGLCRSYLKERISKAESVVFLAASRPGATAGFVQMYPTFGSLQAGRVFVLYDLFVSQDERRKGVGRLLMERAKAHAEEAHARSIVLSTATTNHAAQRLYESLGYRRDVEFFTYELSLGPG